MFPLREDGNDVTAPELDRKHVVVLAVVNLMGPSFSGYRPFEAYR